jgi:Amt family ammonium transporter
MGLRASSEEELVGLDISEHGLVSAYAGFTFTGETPISAVGGGIAEPGIAVPVEIVNEKRDPSCAGHKYTNVTILCNQNRFDTLKHELGQIGITGLTVTQVLGCGMQKCKQEFYRGVAVEPTLLPKVKTEIIVCKVPVQDVITAARRALYTGHIGDGKIFIYNVENVIKIRTAEEGYDALQDTI